MENKEVERDIDKLVRKYVKNSDISLTGSVRGFKIKQYIEQLEQEVNSVMGAIGYACSMVVERENNVKQLEEENKELKKQLLVKDKALDKAIDELMSYQTLYPPTDYDDLKNEIEWKEECMNNE